MFASDQVMQCRSTKDIVALIGPHPVISLHSLADAMANLGADAATEIGHVTLPERWAEAVGDWIIGTGFWPAIQAHTSASHVFYRLWDAGRNRCFFANVLQRVRFVAVGDVIHIGDFRLNVRRPLQVA